MKSMLRSYATGLVAIALLGLVWVAVQSAWQRVFARESSDPDALAGRPGCSGCGRAEPCRRGAAEEEVS
jgi:hypothetical protein